MRLCANLSRGDRGFPLGERAVKVKGNVFLFIRATTEQVSSSVRLPHSRFFVLDLPNTEPTPYGLGKHGWVSAHYPGAPKRSLDMFKTWIDESYRGQSRRRNSWRGLRGAMRG